jgi:hypothetical protein
MGASQEERLRTSPAKFARAVRDPSHTITSDKSGPIGRDRSQQHALSVLKNSVKTLAMAVAMAAAPRALAQPKTKRPCSRQRTKPPCWIKHR